LLLTIEKLIYGGEGLARLPADPDQDNAERRGKAVFIPFVLPEEEVDATIAERRPGFVRARAEKIVSPSSHRIPPDCPYFAQCGGCHYQHADYAYQLEIKEKILRENLRRIARFEVQGEVQVHPSPPWNYRNRSRLQLRTHPVFTLGYFRLASHDVLPVEQCPISSPLINRAITVLWQLGRAGEMPEVLREIEFFANADDSKLLVELFSAADAHRAPMRECAEKLKSSMPEIAGVTVFRAAQNSVQEPLVTVGAGELMYKNGQSAYRVTAGSFFQTNRFLIGELIDIVTRNQSGEVALDLYAGVGLFSTALASNFRHVVSVESSQTAVSDLAYNLPTNGKAIRSATGQYLSGASGKARAEARDWLAEPRSETKMGRATKGELPLHLNKPDVIVVDPPRSGLGDAVARALAGVKAPQLIYVSCDPATLARDIVPLQEAGYRIGELHLVDLFPQTYHLESVVKLEL